MENKTIRDFGKIYYRDYLEDGNKTRISREFFRQLSFEMVKVMGKYYDAVGEFPFYQNEKQSPSYVMPALFSVAEGAAEMETVVTRKTRGGGANQKAGSGFLDYWAVFRDTNFAIEVKHAYSNVKTNGPNQKIQITGDIRKKWSNSREQLRKLKKDEFVDDKYKLVRLSLLILPFYKTTTNSSCGCDCDWDKVALEKFADQFKSELEDYPNLFSFWKLKEEHQEAVFANDQKQAYPVVAFVGHAHVE